MQIFKEVPHIDFIEGCPQNLGFNRPAAIIWSLFLNFCRYFFYSSLIFQKLFLSHK